LDKDEFEELKVRDLLKIDGRNKARLDKEV